MDQERIRILLEKEFSGLLAPPEKEELEAAKRLADRALFIAAMQEAMEQTPLPPVFVGDEADDRAVAAIVETDEPAHGAVVRRLPLFRRWWAAAAVVLLLGASAYFLLIRGNDPSSPLAAAKTTDIDPGRNGAVLTLADGSQVVLDSLGNGLVTTQNGVQVLLKNGELAYARSGKESGATVYNTMTTPKGRQFQVILPDGTKAWLNAASSITYPTTFSGKERLVKITGEAYFEVARNTQQPFRVNVNDKAKVEVLGTHFNVNAYDNELSINATLLEGSIRVKQASKEAVLKPGQQARITAEINVVDHADLEKVMAWKNGLFNFEGAKLEEVMRQLERWYDIEVVYEKGIPDVKLMGELTKDVPLKGLLLGLAKLGVNARLEERKLIVLP